MENLNSVPNFTLSVLKSKNGGVLKGFEPDKDGLYKKIPVYVFDTTSRNRVKYDTNSLIGAMQNPDDRFRKSIEEGCLRGEYGHPTLEDGIAGKKRLFKIDEKMTSHAFTKFYPEKDKDGDILLYADITACGPFGKVFAEDMANKNINKSFSLRAFCAKPEDKGDYKLKRVLNFITFDYVGMAGYEKASTRYAAAATEGFEYFVTREDLENIDGVCDMIGVESLSDQKFLDLFQSDTVQIEHFGKGFVDRQNKVLITPTGEKVSLFETLFH